MPPTEPSDLYLHLRADVLRAVRRVLGPDPEVEDLVQEIFLKVVSNLGRLRDPAKLRNWASAVAANTAYKEIRRRGVRRRSLERLQSEQGDEAGTAGAWDEIDIVRRMDELLDPGDRRALVLRHVNDLTIEEVARVCGCSEATIKRRVLRATETLRRLSV